ncbi:MAG: DUF6527 family protein [bacterium]|nr:DUF6527 family protein [bacterium]
MKKILSFLKELFTDCFLNKNDYCYKRLENEPEFYKNKTIYIISEEEFEWVIMFKCPCGCNEKIKLNLLESSKPKWTYFIKDKNISIFPSVERVNGCKSHFIVNKGYIEWSE